MALPVQLVVLHTARRPSAISRRTACSGKARPPGGVGSVRGARWGAPRGAPRRARGGWRGARGPRSGALRERRPASSPAPERTGRHGDRRRGSRAPTRSARPSPAPICATCRRERTPAVDRRPRSTRAAEARRGTAGAPPAPGRRRAAARPSCSPREPARRGPSARAGSRCAAPPACPTNHYLEQAVVVVRAQQLGHQPRHQLRIGHGIREQMPAPLPHHLVERYALPEGERRGPAAPVDAQLGHRAGRLGHPHSGHGAEHPSPGGRRGVVPTIGIRSRSPKPPFVTTRTLWKSPLQSGWSSVHPTSRPSCATTPYSPPGSFPLGNSTEAPPRTTPRRGSPRAWHGPGTPGCAGRRSRAGRNPGSRAWRPRCPRGRTRRDCASPQAVLTAAVR